MSFDLGVWHTTKRLTDVSADELYADLCEERTDGVAPHPAVDAFYAELTARYPELGSVPDDRIDDSDYCPWSCDLNRSPGHVLMACVWSQAQAVRTLVWNLATKYRLAMFDPQEGRIYYPGG
ncbi:MAG TPA: hypothetical protein VN641_13535 [Urbifossiella sp.]|nr:hypothetical protein [Urbifossiella sp.]